MTLPGQVRSMHVTCLHPSTRPREGWEGATVSMRNGHIVVLHLCLLEACLCLVVPHSPLALGWRTGLPHWSRFACALVPLGGIKMRPNMHLTLDFLPHHAICRTCEGNSWVRLGVSGCGEHEPGDSRPRHEHKPTYIGIIGASLHASDRGPQGAHRRSSGPGVEQGLFTSSKHTKSSNTTHNTYFDPKGPDSLKVRG